MIRNKMKKIFRQVILLAFGLMFALQCFATIGIKTIVKGSFKGLGISNLSLYARESKHSIKSTAVVKSDAQFQLALEINKPGFYMISSNSHKLAELEIYLKPGDQLNINLTNNLFVFSGKGSQLNQFLFDLDKKFPYEADLTPTYNNRIEAIKTSSNMEVVRNRSLLLGNAQGEYLDKVFGPIIESKAHGNGGKILEAYKANLNIQLLPEMMIYPNWWQTLTELLYAKMEAKQLVVRNNNTWVADFGNAIANQKLREEFVLALLDYSVVMGDFKSINAEMKEALPLVKDAKNLAKINALKAKLARNMDVFKYAPTGTDVLSYTFNDLNGKKVSVSDFKGKIIFIDIWNTACMPCVAEMPYLNKLEHDMKGNDIVFLSISCDNKTDLWKKFLQVRNITNCNQLIMDNVKGNFFDKMGKSGIPRFIILDKDGKVLDNNTSKRPSNPLLKIYLNHLLNPA
jgi:thiol-disulfide isomerase/thioredoxin